MTRITWRSRNFERTPIMYVTSTLELFLLLQSCPTPISSRCSPKILEAAVTVSQIRQITIDSRSSPSYTCRSEMLRKKSRIAHISPDARVCKSHVTQVPPGTHDLNNTYHLSRGSLCHEISAKIMNREYHVSEMKGFEPASRSKITPLQRKMVMRTKNSV